MAGLASEALQALQATAAALGAVVRGGRSGAAEAAAPRGPRAALVPLLERPAEELLDWLAAGRVLAALVLLVWASGKGDTSLVVAFVAMVCSAASIPVVDAALAHVGAFLPGVGVSLDVFPFLGPFVRFFGTVRAASTFAMIVLLVTSLLVTYLVFKRSPVLGLALYAVFLTSHVQSGFFDNYPVRLVVPLVLLALSLKSSHIRYLHLAAFVFAVLFVSSGADEDLEIKHLAPIALWAGFAQLVLYDILARVGVVGWMSFFAHLLVLAHSVLVALAYVAPDQIDVDLSSFRPKMTWAAVAEADCLPGCADEFGGSFFGIACFCFCVVSMVRNLVSGRAGIIATILPGLGVPFLCSGLLASADKEDIIHYPHVGATIASLAYFGTLLLGLVNSSSKQLLPATDATGSILSYSRSKTTTQRQGRGSPVSRPDTASKAPRSPEVQRQPSGSGHGGSAPASLLEEHIDSLWRQVRNDKAELAQLEKEFNRKKKQLFNEESKANGIRAYDEESKRVAENARSRCDELRNEVRDLTARVGEFKNIVEKGTHIASEAEAKLRAQH